MGNQNLSSNTFREGSLAENTDQERPWSHAAESQSEIKPGATVASTRTSGRGLPWLPNGTIYFLFRNEHGTPTTGAPFQYISALRQLYVRFCRCWVKQPASAFSLRRAWFSATRFGSRRRIVSHLSPFLEDELLCGVVRVVLSWAGDIWIN